MAVNYRLADGSKLTLAFHEPEVWATRVEMQLRALGCSDEYAGARAELIRSAEEVTNPRA